MTRTAAHFVLAIALAGCAGAPPDRPSLRDIDVAASDGKRATKPTVTKSKEEIRQAYLTYLQHAGKDERTRSDALQRLAQIEFEIVEMKERGKTADAEARDAMADAATDRTITLLETLLRDHPKGAQNDQAMYQLARAYDKRGLMERSIEVLGSLSRKYPASRYYAESQFRIAEYRFIKGDYSDAEHLYTEVLVSKNNGVFKEKAFYKRGWSRFKQGYYEEAVDDFVAAANMAGFVSGERLTAARKSDFDEYLRAIALSFVYGGGPASMSEYFAARPSFSLTFDVYRRTAELYLSQDRYSDAALTLSLFKQRYPESKYLPAIALKTVETWRASGFGRQFVQALDELYANYHPDHTYWKRPDRDGELRTQVVAALKEHILLASAHYHKEYQASRAEASYTAARRWYERFVAHYAAYARKDNVHFLFAELLALRGELALALDHYEKAAFDGDVLVNPNAAYAGVVTAEKLIGATAAGTAKHAAVGRLLRQASAFLQYNRSDPRASAIAAVAAQEAYRNEMYGEAIAIAEMLPSNVTGDRNAMLVVTTKAHAYFKAKRYADAEEAYQAVLQLPQVDAKMRQDIEENLALSIYNQAVAAKAAQNTALAMRHYVRVSDTLPQSSVAAPALFEAATLAYDAKLWPQAVGHFEAFRARYPAHKLTRDVAIKLSSAYLQTNQQGEAASELVRLARTDNDQEYKMAALWKAAGLYETAKDYERAIKSYAEYAAAYPRPYPQYVESLQRLIVLHEQRGQAAQADQRRQQLLDSDRRAAASLKTERTNYLSSLAALSLAKAEHARYAAIKLNLPLERSLRRKKDALQKALNLYGIATSYGVLDTVSEATHGIGEIYYTFSRDLLASERPKGMSKIEQEQYTVLLEDQAFPFEDNAIKFYEKNLLHAKQTAVDRWMRDSHARLKELFPARYDRNLMVESYINVLH